MRIRPYLWAISALSALSFSFAGPSAESDPDDAVYQSESVLPHFTEQDIQELKRLVDLGSGEAAYMLSRYYSTEGRDAGLARSYEDLALLREYPIALYRAALYEWASAPQPDMARIESRARKAIEGGVERARELLDEVVFYKSSGFIPNRTKFRLIVDRGVCGNRMDEKKAAEPGATDNPGDAQRLREDH